MTQNYKLPPGPSFGPLLNTLAWTISPIKILELCHQRYGDIFSCRLVGDRNYIVVSQPEDVKFMFTEFPLVGNDELESFLGINSLFVVQGDKHKAHRKCMAPNFRSSYIDNYRESTLDIVEKATQSLETGRSYDFYSVFQEMVLDITLTSIFGFKHDENYETLRALLKRLIGLSNGPLMYFEVLQKDFGRYSPGGYIKLLMEKVDNCIMKEIEKRRSQEFLEENDVIDSMIKAEASSASWFNARDIIDEVKTLLFATYEPTTSALVWTMYWIHQEKSVVEKLRGELSQYSSVEDAVGNEYLNAVCKEAMRIVPVVPVIERRIDHAVNLKGYHLKAGQRIAASVHLTHQNENIFPNPKRFIPDRFIGTTFKPYEYYPFGGGHRNCLGSHLSIFIVKIIISHLLRECRLEQRKKIKLKPVSRGATIGPSSNLELYNV